MKYTPKQIEKYNRQKYMSFLEKISKNIFKMFRDEKTTNQEFLKTLLKLKKQLDKLEVVRIDTEYHQHLQEYIEKLSKINQDEFILDDELRAKNITLLNRLQKLKKQNSYKKEKHKRSEIDEFYK